MIGFAEVCGNFQVKKRSGHRKYSTAKKYRIKAGALMTRICSNNQGSETMRSEGQCRLFQ